MNWQLGLVVHDQSGCAWVYIGPRLTKSKSIERIFVKASILNGHEHGPWQYQATKWETLCSKFPDLSSHFPAGDLAG